MKKEMDLETKHFKSKSTQKCLRNKATIENKKMQLEAIR